MRGLAVASMEVAIWSWNHIWGILSG